MYIYDKCQFPKLSGIYRIKNIITGKSYVGSSVNLKLRLQKHYYELKKECHNNKHLLRSFKKHGENCFIIEILEVFENINYKDLLSLEKEYIIHFDSLKNGYNLLLDNSSHFKKLNKTKSHIEKNKRRTSKPVYAINIETGKIDYSFNSISDASRFLNTSSSNISRVCKNELNYIKGYNFCYKKDYNKNYNYKYNKSKKGIKFSKKHKENLKKANQISSGKKVFKYTKNFNLVEEYPSIREAERRNNLKYDSIKYKLDKKTLFAGFYWSSTKI